MSGNLGSSPLTPDEADQFEEMFGVRMSHVETGIHGVGNNRAARRAVSRPAKRRGRLSIPKGRKWRP